ncbi:citrulline utilization hydrolase CtlX [Lutimonas zeaxanthinifaciens]|uniref:citrulline utilization hydrolase CtlX n=1 Tax=Lutimonas zeaxanthinifaciens TaxID=3060215 RepID=UPI00265D39DD|nr:arginine deiminase-related protein [Lutimonas sp. YSD2104]WKK66820.1 arginine deiminase-related protein [Lutimonas sp. YSD2104]
MKLLTNTILMIRPVSFRMNEETAVNNYYQHEIKGLSAQEVQEKALAEFDAFVAKLREAGVNIIVVEDTMVPDTPDSIFPNNWISFHSNGKVGVFPMFAENRRQERREDIFDILEEKGFVIEEIVDYTSAEEEELFLEATGSIVLDRAQRIAYCALSPRADEDLFIEFCEDFEYTPVIFHAYQTVDGNRELIYHTNVMMAVTRDYVVACLDCIDDKKEKKNFIKQVKASGKRILDISEEQVEHFAGNMLQVMDSDGNAITVMSQSAYDSLSSDQIAILSKEAALLSSDLGTIEACGGGSARCMMAEVFLGKKS